MEMDKTITIRINEETNEEIRKLLAEYPNDYSNYSAIIRAAVYTLYRWKTKREMKLNKNN